MMNKKEMELRELASSFEVHKAQLEQLARQEDVLRMTLEDHLRASETMKRFADCKVDSELLIPVGANVFLYGKVGDNSKAITGVGADVAVEGTIEDALQKLDLKIKELRDAEAKLTQKRDELNDKVLQISNELQAAYDASRTRAARPQG